MSRGQVPAARSRKKDKRFRKSRKVIAVLVLIVCSVLCVKTFSIRKEISETRQQQEELQSQIEEAKTEQEQIEQKSENQNSDAYIEELARDKLGLIYENEIIFKKQGR